MDPRDPSKRSSHWPKVEHEHVKLHPACAGCGFTHVEVHHVKPFHLFPELELDETNLITLCRSGNNCHLLIGHGDDFNYYNLAIREDANELLASPHKLSMITARAKANRKS